MFLNQSLEFAPVRDKRNIKRFTCSLMFANALRDFDHAGGFCQIERRRSKQ